MADETGTVKPNDYHATGAETEPTLAAAKPVTGKPVVVKPNDYHATGEGDATTDDYHATGETA
ncbi:hypothetical protein ABT127_35360 [Streptomyces sp. NPDC001904]|uniref:hypothetical protein n=1 Tax=Streptomyces sp. NPDC001904 TaxID=3154531 RepID=UPI00332C2049